MYKSMHFLRVGSITMNMPRYPGRRNFRGISTSAEKMGPRGGKKQRANEKTHHTGLGDSDTVAGTPPVGS